MNFFAKRNSTTSVQNPKISSDRNISLANITDRSIANTNKLKGQFLMNRNSETTHKNYFYLIEKAEISEINNKLSNRTANPDDDRNNSIQKYKS